MLKMIFHFGEKIVDILKSLTTEQITLFSIIVTIIIFIASRHSEVKFKRLETRRTEYTKFIKILQKVYMSKLVMNDKTKNEFFDMGMSLLIYGSKKVYKKYMFFREFSSNPLIKQSTFYDDKLSLYIIADILKCIRREVGLSNFGNLDSNEALSFFVNDIGMNPIAKVTALESSYKIKAVKFELYFIDRIKLIYINKVFFIVIKPVLAILQLALKYLIILPMSKLIIKIFPGSKITLEEHEIESIAVK